MKKNITMSCVLGLILIAVNAHSETIVFEGTPISKSVSTPQESLSEKVEGDNQNNSKLIITKEGNDYVYFSRNKTKLRYFKTDYGWLYFQRPDHTDFIKIMPIPDGGKLPGLEKMKYLYMESISDGMKSIITYWGYAEKFEP